ncbi:MAG: HlyD family secretion protein [Janthinobacterium lividum]
MASDSLQTAFGWRFKTWGIALVSSVLLALTAFFAWSHTEKEASTDDAQIDGHVHPLNARVGGTITWVNPDVDDTKFVQAGTVLARLDTNDYTPSIDRLKGDVQSEQAQLQSAQLAVPITQATSSSKLVSARAAVTEATAELASAQAGEASARAQIDQAAASHTRAEGDRSRYEQLVNAHEISRSEYDQRMTESKVSEAQQTVAQQNLLAAQERVTAARQHIAERQSDVQAAASAPELIATSRSNVERVSGELKKSQATLHDAELNLSYTNIIAPVSGVVGRKQIEAGQRVAPGQLLLNIVPTNDLWVIANFKETQLRHMTIGSSASVHVDAYGTTLPGKVESIGGATGSKYALLAPENATGNYVKVIQRIPVRIHISMPDDQQHPLLPGMSVETSVQLTR